ncbi:hypothetical protein ACK330_17160, partial [Aeromonas taiwanensis]
EGDGGDQITKSSVSSIQAASIWATTPLPAPYQCPDVIRPFEPGDAGEFARAAREAIEATQALTCTVIP